MKPEIIQLIQENVKRVEFGQALTVPLILLNDIPEFKMEYERIEQEKRPIFHCAKCKKEVKQRGYCSEECRKKCADYSRNYKRKHGSKPREKSLITKKEYNRKYYHSNHHKEWYNNYIQKPEVQERIKKYHRERYKNPEIRTKRITQAKERYHRLRLQKAMEFIFK